MAIREEIELDLLKPMQYVNVRLQQNDGLERKVDVTMIANGEIYVVPPTANVALRMQKRDGSPIYNTCEKIDETKFSFTVTSQMSALSGRQPAQLQIIDSTTGGTLKTVKFHMLIDEEVINDTMIVSSGEFTALEDAMLRVGDIAISEEVRVDNESERILDELARKQAEIDRVNSFETDKDALITQKAIEIDEAKDAKIEEVGLEFQAKYDGLEVEYAGELTGVKSQLQQKANENLVVKKGYGTLNDFDETTRAILQGLEVGHINAVLGERNVIPSNTSFLEEKVISDNQFNENNVKNGYSLSASSGNESANTNYCYGEKYISVVPNEVIIGNFINAGIVCYYDSNKTFLSGVGVTTTNTVLTIPNNVYYIRVSIPKSWLGTFRINRGNVLQSYDHYEVGYDFDKTFIPSTVPLDINKVTDHSIPTTKLNFITDVVGSYNIFNKDTVTNGYHLSISTGNATVNESFCYSDYIEVDQSYDYICPSGNRLVCFYDKNKTFISGVSATSGKFTTPNNCAYIRTSIIKTDLGIFRLNKGTILYPYDDYAIMYQFDKPLFSTNEGNTTKKLGVVFVAKDGTGDYTSVTSAVLAATNGNTIFVKPGLYENEVIESWGKTVSIIGVDKNKCIIQNTDGTYVEPPMEIASGLVRNLTIKALKSSNPATTGSQAYSVHVEHEELYNNTLTFENCILYSERNWALGMGMRGGCTVEFKGCDFICDDGSHGGVFFHDAASDLYVGVQNVRFIDCNIFSRGLSTTDLKIQSQCKAGTIVNVEFIRTNVRNLDTGVQTLVLINDNQGVQTSVYKISDLINFVLSKGSYGNSLSALNYV